jgi:hypothetical protein
MNDADPIKAAGMVYEDGLPRRSPEHFRKDLLLYGGTEGIFQLGRSPGDPRRKKQA